MAELARRLARSLFPAPKARATTAEPAIIKPTLAEVLKNMIVDA